MSWTRTCVLVPTDFSDASLAALDEARAIVDDPAHLHVLHVLHPIHPAEPGMLWGAVDDGRRIAHVEEHLREHLAVRGLSAAHAHCTIGDEGLSITELASSLGADLVVLASHGRTGLSRVLLGSVAERVARHSPCPVLIVRSVPA
ncbi:MAG: universal stress protein [Alphaproteobacteria bacterium]|nr:universal stress protein [Alphaproteobacteria bacterium]MCB9691108.1 universal stress protein [Alphaproteobacteria bacterium]